MPDPALLLLAAGAGKRFGGGKLRAEIAGRPLLRNALDLALQTTDRVHVVLGADAEALQPLLPAGVVPIIHAGWAEGMGSSLAAGVRALPADCTGVLVLLADQPALPVASLHALIARWREDPRQVCCARYAGQPGVPALFPRRLFGELATLSGDRGAKSILQREAAADGQFDLPEAGIDIDTRADLAAYIASLRA
jgi:CTP:molybdopterin cytidylyltransferase MocA